SAPSDHTQTEGRPCNPPDTTIKTDSQVSSLSNEKPAINKSLPRWKRRQLLKAYKNSNLNS
ncbi:MAG: hypothetical protein K2J74_03415, partial [Muribaculaceae bacterium]|nr:hypothetical protein [Muribaculaceae bacterium]